ncbi:Protein ecm33 [Lasiodiplodia theobromae]|uniref:Protein ecm33 n=1 Tax=Lasiodiplodia theobromae TaxID=45133 RepID=A0A5N5CZ36_9PEZI|nr:Protein ecm33 [Lasiodiplodia theobromae]
MAPKIIQLAALWALVGFVAGQNATLCSSAATKTISSQDDADKLGAACPTFTGNVLLADGPLYSRVALNGIEEITGKLTVHDWMEASSDSLVRIGGNFENINSYTWDIIFPALEYVGGSIIFTEEDQYRSSLQRALFPSLKQVHGDLLITGNHYFQELQAPNIEHINGLFKMVNQQQIANVTMNKLVTVQPGGIQLAGSFGEFSIVSTGSGNCSEWDALRQPGGALANVNYYHCQGGCERLYGEECYCPGANYPSQSC